jgi:hypothetical protein
MFTPSRATTLLLKSSGEERHRQNNVNGADADVVTESRLEGQGYVTAKGATLLAMTLARWPYGTPQNHKII